MSEDQGESGSSGMMIGMIAGGAVVLLLLVGGAFMFLLRGGSAPVAAPPPGPMAAPTAPEPGGKGGKADPAPQKPAASGSDRLLGTWEAKLSDRERVALYLEVGGKVRLNRLDARGEITHRTGGTWSISEDQGKQATLRYTTEYDARSHHKLVFAGDDSFTVQSERHADSGAVQLLAGVNLDGVTLQRRK